MREILFKAKRIDNGEWVEGFYVYTFNEDKKCPVIGVMTENHWIVEKNGNMVLVDKETICQYTGLTDKHGNKIWENDVVDTLYDIEYVGVSAQRLGKSVVVFKDGCYMKDRIGEAGLYHFIPSDKDAVIGNIFDNKELLRE